MMLPMPPLPPPLLLLLLLAVPRSTDALSWSAGFSDEAVFQRGGTGVKVYGFAESAAAVKVTIAGSAVRRRPPGRRQPGHASQRSRRRRQPGHASQRSRRRRRPRRC
jgi:hypothetical protein